MNLNIHFDLADLVIYAAVAGVVWHLIGNFVQGLALQLNAKLLHKAELKKQAIEVALAEQKARYQKAAREEYNTMLAMHAQAESARQASLEALPEVKN